VTDLRILVAKALLAANQSDGWVTETHVDRVRALAGADPLGAALWRLKYAHDASSFRTAAFLLARRIRRKHEAIGLMHRVAARALIEYLDGICRSCGGRGFVADAAGVRKTCGTCGGSGSVAPSEVRRMAAFDGCRYAKIKPRLDEAAQKLLDADIAAGVRVAMALGRRQRVARKW
jgi:hypothetical protein